jgi:hypothetical protein
VVEQVVAEVLELVLEDGGGGHPVERGVVAVLDAGDEL